MIDDREAAPECPGPFKVCRFTSCQPDFDVQIKVNRKIWLSHYALKSCNADEEPNFTPEHEIRFWQFIAVDADGKNVMLHNQREGAH